MSTPIVGIIMGAIFGASLVLAGLTDPDKIIGTLRLKDFHAMRTVAVFVLVGMLGTWFLQSGEAANLNIKPAAILTVLIGGAFLGIGLGLTGFGPGTGLASAASGRIDALTAVIGMFFGAHTYVLIYPSIVMRLERILNYGKVTLPQVTGAQAASWVVPVFATGSLALLLTRPGKPRDAVPHDKAGDLRMNGDYSGAEDLLLATDCVEAAQVFRRWKNFLFMIMVLCLLLLQASFWLVRTGHIEIDKDTYGSISVVLGDNGEQADEAAKQVVAQPDESIRAELEAPRKLSPFGLDMTFEHAASAVRVANATLVLTSVLYGLTMFCGLTVSLGGGLRGLSHICRAFYLSLVMLILLLPWQMVFGPIALGAIYTPQELVNAYTADASSTLSTALLYLRFTGCGALVVLVLILAQWRSCRWTKVVLRRLEQVV
ncbi:MAG: YeeE/YedE family protein [Planctomycetota bacterium]|jgi:hypothetical protein